MIDATKNRIKGHHISFKNAFAGVIYVFKTQPNFLVHAIAAFIALFLAAYLRVTTAEFILIVFTIVLVLMAEMVNTAVESVTDLISPEWHEKAKIAKDVSAGMVLVSAVGSIIVGILIFGKYLI